jgi:hypothetical protein
MAIETISDSELLFHLLSHLVKDNVLTGPYPLELRVNEEYREYAISNGWVTWPINYDPRWLETCKGYERRTDEDELYPHWCSSREFKSKPAWVPYREDK